MTQKKEAKQKKQHAEKEDVRKFLDRIFVRKITDQ
jgi:hypothetical protein